MLRLQAKTLAKVGARKGWREASPTTCSLRVKNLMFYIIKFSHLKSNRLAGGTPTRPRHASLRPLPGFLLLVLAPPSRGCALVRPALRRSNMAASASIRRLGQRVSGSGWAGGRAGGAARCPLTLGLSAGAGVQLGAALRLARPAHLRGLRQGECSGRPRRLGAWGRGRRPAAP